MSLVNFQNVQAQSTFDRKLEGFWITLAQPFLFFLPKSNRFQGKSQSRDNVLTGRFTFRDPKGRNILKSEAETRKFLDTSWSQASIISRMLFVQKVFVKEPAVDVGTKTTIISWDDLRDWFYTLSFGNSDGLCIEKMALAKAMVVFSLPHSWNRQCIS